jgi:hypothetical protein
MLAHLKDWQAAPLWTAESIKGATKEWHEYLGK